MYRIIQLGLTAYSLTTILTLGDILLFMEEMYTTVTASVTLHL